MRKKAKITVTKTFGKEDLRKILKKIIRSNLLENRIIVSNDLRGDD